MVCSLTRCALLVCLWLTLSSAARAEAPLFPKEGVAFVQKHCVFCHNETKHEGELRLDQLSDVPALLKSRKIAEKMLDRLQAGEMPPEDKPQPSVEEVNAFVTLVNGVFEQADREAPPDPGRVTVRRLNRAEYTNTIRDLIVVDFDPTADFPSDDIGHGFDNIGDVLTVSPVLMERYLAAAESISQRAITPVPPNPPVRAMAARYTEPATKMEGQFRTITPEMKDSPVDAGPVHTLFVIDPEGEHIAKVRVYAETTGKLPVKISILACGAGNDVGPKAATDAELATLAGPAVDGLKPLVILQTFEVTSRDRNAPQIFQAKFPPTPGLKRIAIAVQKWPEGEPAPKVYLEWIVLDGPMDTRPATQRRLLACTADAPQPQQTREVLTRLMRKAFRRPPTDVETERLAKLVQTMVDGGEKWEAAIQRALQAILVSPKFLFRLELDDRPDAPEPRAIGEYELASRLSYFLWSSMPDDELLDLAGKQQLSANLEPQVRRMLQDLKSQALVDNFAMQWLQLRRLKQFAPDATLFPAFNEPLRQAMLKETELFFATIIKEDRSVLELLDSDFTFMNQTLARHYGIADTAGNKVGAKADRPNGQPFKDETFVRVNVAGTERGGLLTQAGILTVTSNPTRTSPVKRGRWVLEQILGTPPPPPPANVPELAEGSKAALTGTLRQRMEQHRANPNCANCHARMDPIGFAFENYDAIGAWRTKDGEFPIESAGKLAYGRAFQDAAELKVLLKEKKELVRRCVAEKLLIYALGRGLEYSDRPTLARLQSAIATDDRFSKVILEIVNSDPFRMRRGLPKP